MNKGTANRTFYYRDSKEGSFTITVKAIGRETAEVWIATQLINVGSGSASQSQGQVLGDSTVTSNTGSQSATAGAVAPTYATPASQLEVSAGGDRLTAPGSPISFQALIKKNASGNGGLTFAWSFGDGEVGDGSLVTHTYKYPGEYAVILNVKAGNVFGVSRLKVKVMVPEISVSERDDYIEITNNAGSEVNLFNWKIIANHRAFIFQPDTIVLPKTSIKVDKKLLLLKGEVEVRPTLKNFLGQVVARSPKVEIVDPDYQNGSSNINTKTSLINTNSINQRSKKETGVVAGESVEYQQVLERPTTTEPLGKVIYESKKSENFFEKIKGFLGRLFD
jgi:hypothetical protein